MGNLLLAAAAKSSSGSALFLPMLLLIIGVFYLLMIRPQRNRQRRIAAVQDSVLPGQRIRTTAGMYGTVTAVEDGDLMLEVAPGVEVRILKRAVMEVLSDSPADGFEQDGHQQADGRQPDAGAGTSAEDLSVSADDAAGGRRRTELGAAD